MTHWLALMTALAVTLQPQMLTPAHVLTLHMMEILTQALALIILFIQTPSLYE